MSKAPGWEAVPPRFARRWNAVALAGSWMLVAGCAMVPVYEEVPPAALGPTATITPPPRPIAKSVAPADPPRSPGWDAPEPPSRPGGVPAPAPPPQVMREEFVAVQTMLDRANFSPGCIDGRPGHQSRAALAAWQRAEGLAASGEVDEAVQARLAGAGELYSSHPVSASDHEGLAPVPTGWRNKALVPALNHATVQERLAEQYHLSQRALQELNPAAAWPNPPAGTVLKVPRVTPSPKVLAARIEIHLAGKYLEVFDHDGKLAAHFPCSIARDKAKRPVGELHVANAAENPNYTFKPELFAEDPESASIGGNLIIPPGPNNPVGVAWLSLDRPGYGIHGTPKPEEIGRTESHGCFRLANWNARKLLDMVTLGTPVQVFE